MDDYRIIPGLAELDIAQREKRVCGEGEENPIEQPLISQRIVAGGVDTEYHRVPSKDRLVYWLLKDNGEWARQEDRCAGRLVI